MWQSTNSTDRTARVHSILTTGTICAAATAIWSVTTIWPTTVPTTIWPAAVPAAIRPTTIWSDGLPTAADAGTATNGATMPRVHGNVTNGNT